MIDEIELLAWDSKFFKRRVGRLNLNEGMSLSKLLQLAHQKRYELLYIYSSAQIEKSPNTYCQFLDVGGHIAFSKDLPSCNEPEEIKSFSGIHEYRHDVVTPELLEIAFLSGHLSRFKTDPLLPAGGFECLYETWLTNTLRNRPKTSIYTYCSGGKVAGFITSELHGAKCSIDLLAVLQSYQGQGIATKLIKHLCDICRTKKIGSIEVKTQLSNRSARALYEKNSFSECQRSFLYHAHFARH